MMKRFIRQKNRNSKTMGVVLLIAVLCLSVVYAALYSVIYMYGTGSVDISYKDLYYWVDTSTGKGNFYTSCTNGTATSSTGITKMSVAVNALKEGGTIHMLSPYSATAEETVSVNSKTVKIQRYVQKGENNKVEHSNEKEPLFNVSANLKFDLVKVGTEAPCLTIDGSEITSDASAFNVLSGGTLTLNNDADGVAQGTFVVTGNYAKMSGGAVNLSGGSLVANAVQFTDNRSINTLESYGGAIYASGGSNVTLNNCSFENNTARSSTKINVEGTIYQKGEHPAYGGAVYSISSTVNMSGCTFTANAADVEGNNGVLASGGAVYIGSQSSGSMKDCTVTNNQTSYNGRTGAGVCVAEGGNSFAFSGKTIIEGNHCYFLRADIDNGLNENDNLHLEGEASNISVDTSKLSAGSKIYITASPSPSENSDFRSLISDKSHKASSTGYFESDVGGYVVQSNTDSDDGGLYLVAGSSYDNLWYGCKNIYQFDRYGKVDGNYFHYGFFGDEALTQDTGFTRLTDAVAALQTGGKIHMLKTYKVSVSETVNMPENKTVNVVRESSLGGNSMFKLQEGTFIINSLKDSSTIIFDGQGQNLSASTSGGAFSAARNTDGGENNFELNGIQKSDGTKSIIIQNNKITGSYNSGAGLYIWSDKSKISNCEIRNNSTEKTGGGIYFSNSMGSYVLENCNVTNNTASQNGGGVYLDYGTYSMLGTMNITGNTVNGAANNLYVVNAVGLASGSSSLNTGSQIGLTTSSTPAEGSNVKFASSATEAMKACFTPDVSDYKVKYNSSDNGLYLIVPIYSELWYKADENDANTKKFFEGSDVNNLTATDITKFSKAVQCLRADGKIHMLTTYESTENETTTMTAGKNVTVLRDGTFNNASMFKITKGTFEIDATDESSSVTFDGQKIETTVDKGGAFYVDGGSIKFSGAEKTVENKKEKTIVIKDNIISRSSDTSSVYAYGGGVYIYGGTNTLENCSIIGNKVSASSTTKSTYAYGGGVYIEDSGTNTLTNCSITGNTVSSKYAYGGGFYNDGGTNTLTNCSITGNTASSSSDAKGGGACIGVGTNTLTSCSITNNKVESSSSFYSAEGGGVNIGSGTNTLTNCSITENKAESSSDARGGGVNIGNGTNTLENCSITKNKASSSDAKGGGVFIDNKTNTLLGTMNITGNTAIFGSDSSDNNLYLNGSYTVALSDSNGNKLSAGSQIGVITDSDPTSGTDQKFATNATEEMKACFTADNSDYYVSYKDSGLYLSAATRLYYSTKSGSGLFYKDEACTESTGLTKLTDAVGSIDSKGNIYMMSQYASSADETVDVTAGKSIRVIRHKDFKDASMFSITGGTFKINATDASSSITFDGNKIETKVNKGGVFCVDGGSINFNGADKSGGGKTITVENNAIFSYTAYGGGVYIGGSETNTLSNCSITGNTATSTSAYPSVYGGGVYIEGSGTNTLTDCSITGNTVSSTFAAFGGGVCIKGGTNTLTNCSITGNKAESSKYAYGCGVCISKNTTLLGTTNITGNTDNKESLDNNLCLKSSYTVALSDSNGNKLSTSSQIGVTTEKEPTERTDVQFATNATEEMKACFTDDTDTSGVIYKNSGLYLRYATKLYYKEGKFYSDEACTTATSYTKLSDAVGSISSVGKIYMMSQYASSADETVSVTGGKSIEVIRHKSFTDASMFSITGGTFTVSTDASSLITFDGKNITPTAEYKGGAFNVYQGSATLKLIGAEKSDGVSKTIVIRNNIVTGTDCWGGGIYCRKTTNVISNCNIINNSAEYGGGIYLDYGTNTISNCNITDNKSTNLGAGIACWEGTNLMTGSMKITGNKTSNGENSNIFFNSSTTSLADSSSNKQLSTSSQIGVTTETAPTEGTDIQFATNATAEMKACFTHDLGTSEVVYKDGGLYLSASTRLYYSTKSGSGLFYKDEACTESTGLTKLTDAVGSIDSNGKIYMMSQYASSADETVSVTGGKSIRVIRHKDFKDASMFKITGGTFEVSATDESSSITFDGQKIQTTVDKGGVFYVDGGSIKFRGAEKTVENKKVKTIVIKDNIISLSSDTSDVYAYGGGVCIRGGTNTLENCSITGNTASASASASACAYGGGVCIESGGKNTLTNCSITDNTVSASSSDYASAYGGGIYLNDNGTHTLENCSITGNTASVSSPYGFANGGGVYISDNTTLLLGTMNITGNTVKNRSDSSDNNLYLASSSYPVLLSNSNGGTLNTSSQIGVTTGRAPTSGTDQKFARNATEEMKACFTHDPGTSEVVYKDGGLYLKFVYSDLYYKNSKFYSDSACSNATGITKFSDAVSNMASKSMIHMMSQYASSASETVTVPAGKSIRVARDSSFTTASMFKITGGTFTVNATDTSSSITFDGQNITPTAEYMGGAFYVDGGSINFNGADKLGDKTIIVENNIISSSSDSSSVKTYGGGIYINNGTNTLVNCNITDNKVSAATSRLNASASAFGGGVYIKGGTNTFENCSIKYNTATASVSYTATKCYAYGGGVYINSGTNTLLGNMKITLNTAEAVDGNSYNLHINNGVAVALSSGSKSLSTNSNIGFRTGTMLNPGTFVEFATGATSDMAYCFTYDGGIYKVNYRASKSTLYVDKS